MRDVEDAVPCGRVAAPGCRAGPMCPAAKYTLSPAGHAGPALQRDARETDFHASVYPKDTCFAARTGSE